MICCRLLQVNFLVMVKISVTKIVLTWWACWRLAQSGRPGGDFCLVLHPKYLPVMVRPAEHRTPDGVAFRVTETHVLTHHDKVTDTEKAA